MQLLDIWLAELKAEDTNYLWTIFFSSPRLSDDLEKRRINSSGTVWPTRKDMPPDSGPKKLKSKRSDIWVRTRRNLTALVWKDS
jgi:hypothetical protein